MATHALPAIPATNAISDRVVAGRINALIVPRYATLLIGGAVEPEYLPSTGRTRAIIRYTRDHAQSALHEIAHWCLAGASRRRLRDYGYWYVPPPRSTAQQAAFFAVEESVQALECLFAEICGLKFHVSADDPDVDAADFSRRVAARAERMRAEGLGSRARAVCAMLAGRSQLTAAATAAD
jgi:elongation factor P hydroxylase